MFQGRLFRKYAVYFVVLVGAALLTSGTIGLYFAYQENRAALVRLQQEKAAGAAFRIEQFVKEIEHQIGWTRLPQASGTWSLEQLRYEYLKLLRQVPAITEVAHLNNTGRERLRVSRLALDVVDGEADRSEDPSFLNTRSGEPYFGPVYFRKQTEPYTTIGLPEGPKDSDVTVVEVNLKFVWDVVSRIKIGQQGFAYVVDGRGRLIAHPDIVLVLQMTDYSELPQVQAALASLPLPDFPSARAAKHEVKTTHERQGRSILTAYDTIEPLGWIVFVEQPESEAFAPLNALVVRISVLLLLGLLVAILASLILTRRMVSPIRALQSGAADIGGGDLNHRIEIHTGDELEALAEQFNEMAAKLQESYAGLERKVEERTRQLEIANQTKSRFLAAASHDLRQPMHALGLFVAQLRDRVPSREMLEIVEQAQAAVEDLGSLLDALLDISKLDADAVVPEIKDFSVGMLMERMETSLGVTAREKGLDFRVVPTSLLVRSDLVLLERILLNLVSNAIRYTARGGRVLLGCRRHGSELGIEVHDTGSGIPEERQDEIFQEFLQLENPERDRAKGLGLGLAIVQRLSVLLDHRIELSSTPGKGSRFSVRVPVGETRPDSKVSRAAVLVNDHLAGALVVVVDDDVLVREGMRGLLSDWGCLVTTAGTATEALAQLEASERLPDAVVCDYRLPDGTGIEAIEQLRDKVSYEVPAVLVSGDTSPELLLEAGRSGYPLLHKPVRPVKLRALLSQLLARDSVSHPSSALRRKSG